MIRILLILPIVLISCRCTKPSKKEQIERLTYQVDSLTRIAKDQDEMIDELYDRIDGLNDALQIREGEISYWGHKYDSIVRVKVNKK